MEVQFGHEIREKEFLLRKDTIFLNNGSYGTTPKDIFNKQTEFREEMESHPDVWFRRNRSIYMNESRVAVAKYFGADEKDMVFVENATTGINTVLKSVQYIEGDALLVSDMNYAAITNAAHRTASLFKGVVLQLSIPLPIESEDDVVKKYEDFFHQHNNIRIAIIDYISSASGIVWPIKKLTEVCHRHNCMVVIDGAHCPGHIKDLNIEDLGVDFFTGNLHKWCFVPRGCAILWVNPKHQSWVRPLVTSWGHDKGFQEEFLISATRDYTGYITAKYFIDFIDKIGGLEKIYKYNTELITKARDYLLEEWKEWKVEKLAIPGSMEAPFMRLIKIPGLKGYENNFDLETAAFEALVHINDISNVQTCIVNINKDLYVRLSVHVYNEIADYKKLADVMKNMLA